MDAKLLRKLQSMSVEHYRALLDAQADELSTALQEAWRNHDGDGAMKFGLGHRPHVTRNGSLWTVGGSLTIARRHKVVLDDTPLDMHDMFGYGEEGAEDAS